MRDVKKKKDVCSHIKESSFYMGASVRTEYEVQPVLLPSGHICARPTNSVLCVLKHTNPHLSALLHV